MIIINLPKPLELVFFMFGIWNISLQCPTMISKQSCTPLLWYPLPIVDIFWWKRHPVSHQNRQGRNPVESPRNDSLWTYSIHIFVWHWQIIYYFTLVRCFTIYVEKNTNYIGLNEFLVEFSTMLNRSSLWLEVIVEKKIPNRVKFIISRFRTLDLRYKLYA